jgi:thioredoxin-related protein
MARIEWILIFLFIPLHAVPHAGAKEGIPCFQEKEDVDLQIRFEDDYQQALEKAARTGTPLILFFRAVWCPRCRKMKEEALSSARMHDLAAEFLWVDMNLDRDLSLARAYHVDRVPQFIFLNPEGRPYKKLVGYFRIEEFTAAMRESLSMLKTGEFVSGEVIVVSHRDPDTGLTRMPAGYRGHATCFSHVGYGPLDLHSQSPFQALRLGLIPRSPSILGDGQFELKTTATWVNVWAYKETEYRLDYEMLQTTASLAYGLSDTVQLEAELENRSRFGGAMDGFIQGFHDAFNIDQNHRDDFSKGDFAFDIAGSLQDEVGRAHFRQSLSLTLQHNLSCGTEDLPAFSYAVTTRFKLNDSGDIKKDDLVDLGASFSLARRFGDFYAYLIPGFAYFGKEKFHGIELKETQLSCCAALEWRYATAQSLILQYLFSEGVARGLSPFSKPSHEATLGWKAEVLQDAVLELGLIENLITHDNSPDFGLHAGLTFRF